MRINLKALFVWLAASVLFVNSSTPLVAQTGNSVGGGANGGSAQASVTILGVTTTVTEPPIAPVSLPPEGGLVTDQADSRSLEAAGIQFFSTGIVTNTTSGTVGATSAHAEGTSTVDGLNILAGLITADSITSRSASDGNGTTASSSAAGTVIDGLVVGGTPVDDQGVPPNTTIPINGILSVIAGLLPVNVPVSGTIVLNSQTFGGDGVRTSSLTVTGIQGTISGAVAGVVSISLSFTVATASSSVNFASAPNSPPVLSLPGAQTVQAGGTLTFNTSASDPNAGDTVTLTGSNIPPNASLTPNPATGNPATSQFSFSPSPAQAGQTFTVNFTATDSQGASTSGSVQIVVLQAGGGNRPPVVSLPGPQTVQVGFNVTFSASASDPDVGDTVTLTGSNIPSGATLSPNPATGNPATSQFSFTPSQSQAGQTFVINFTATDSRGGSTPGSVQITVQSADGGNRPPIISVPGPQIAEAGKTLQFVVTASDPDGDAVSISAGSVPPNASFDTLSGVFTFNPSLAQVGQFFVTTFTATDSRGASTQASVDISVVPPADDGKPGPPVISVPPSPQIVRVGQKLEFGVTATSPSPQCQVTVSVSGLPANSTFDPATGTFSFTPASNQKDKTFVVVFTASDCVNQSASAGVTIIVIGDAGGGTGPGHLCVPVTKINFAATPAGENCGFVTVSLINAGDAALNINSISLANGTDFRVEGPSSMPLTLPSAGVVELKILFVPKQQGAVTDSITISSSDPDQPSVVIQLKGKGAKSN